MQRARAGVVLSSALLTALLQAQVTAISLAAWESVSTEKSQLFICSWEV